MQIIAKIGSSVDITYHAAKHTTGLIDVVAEIYDETRAKDVVNFPDVTLTEIGVTGVYYGSFTPDVAGIWTVMVNSVTKSGPQEFTIVVGNYDLDDLGTVLDDVQTKVSDLSDPSMLV